MNRTRMEFGVRALAWTYWWTKYESMPMMGIWKDGQYECATRLEGDGLTGQLTIVTISKKRQKAKNIPKSIIVARRIGDRYY